jgi:hypothetical protein
MENRATAFQAPLIEKKWRELRKGGRDVRYGQGKTGEIDCNARASQRPCPASGNDLVERIGQTLSTQNADCYGMNSSAFALLTATPKRKERRREDGTLSNLLSCAGYLLAQMIMPGVERSRRYEWTRLSESL